MNAEETRVKRLESALRKLIRKASECDGWESFPEDALEEAREALEKSPPQKIVPHANLQKIAKENPTWKVYCKQYRTNYWEEIRYPRWNSNCSYIVCPPWAKPYAAAFHEGRLMWRSQENKPWSKCTDVPPNWVWHDRDNFLISKE